MKAGASNPDRVVFDTNILISAYLWKGLPRKALELARSYRCQLVISNETIREFVRVLAYPKFALTSAEIAPIIEDLASFSLYVPVRTHVNVIKIDTTDNIFLSLAVDSRAKYIISGDHHLLLLKKYRWIDITNVSRFVQRFMS